MRKVLIVVLALAALALASAAQRPAAGASTPGTQAAPLLTCPNVNGSDDNRVTVGDILFVIQAFFIDQNDPDYVFMYDLDANGQERVTDIVLAGQRFYELCPLVDTQVAQATRWLLVQHPELMVENVSALNALGYYGGPVVPATETPGQGRHYFKIANWNGVFDPAAEPDGLVYNGGRLSAHLYVADGAAVGYLAEDPGPDEGPCSDGIDNGGDGYTDGADADCVLGPPSGDELDHIDIDRFCYPEACSWATIEGWHLHHYFCFIHTGTSNISQFAINPNAHQPPYDPDCQAANNTGCACGGWYYRDRLGWMGHLWNWLPNANVVGDVNGTMNGRFADCFPDDEGWKAYNCPQ